MKRAKRRTKKIIPSGTPARLRSRAEAMLKKNPGDISKMAARDVQILVHELQVHQVELEMQNEECRRIQLQLEVSRDRFAELYDFAPVSYLTFDEDGVILEANLMATTQLGTVRRNLISKKITQFIARTSQDEFYKHRQL